ncbi:MAG: energy-coupling factor transporter transmembrane component T [Flaviflexus sp.]|nr:energy-coupling factor transporter transmembrane component T [Flaviflexus sp.]
MARLKLAGLVIAGILTAFIPHSWLAPAALVVALAWIPVGGRAFLTSLKPAPFIILMALGAQFLTVVGGTATPAEAGVVGAVMAGRILLLMSLAAWVNATTELMDIADAVVWYSRPLSPIIDSDKLGLAIILAIRCLPVAGREAEVVRIAQRARGSRSFIAFGTAYIIRVLRKALVLGEALSLRGVDSPDGRPSRALEVASSARPAADEPQAPEGA